MTFADRLEELRKAATPGEWQEGIHGKSGLVSFDGEDIRFVTTGATSNLQYIAFLANNADAILELVRAAVEIPEILRNWEPDHSSGLERKKIVAFQNALAKLNGEQT